MKNGWVKLHRKIIDNEVFRHDKTAWNVFETLLVVADSKTGKWSGGMHQLSDLCNIGRNTLYKAILRLELTGMVNRSVNSQYTVYNICNWSEYQGNGKQSGKRSVNSEETASNTLTRNRSRNKNNTTKVVLGSEQNEISKLYYQYLNKYRIPVRNHNILKSKIKDMERLNGAEWCTRYLNFMINEYELVKTRYKPEITESLDLYNKSKKIETLLINNKSKQEIY